MAENTDSSEKPKKLENPTYLVRLGENGQWQWTMSPSPKFISDYYVRFPPDSTPGYLVDLGPDYKTLDPEKEWPWKVVSVQDLYHDDIHGAKTLLKEGWGALSYQWGEFLPFSKTNPRYKYRPIYPDRVKVNLPTAYLPPFCSPDTARAWNWGIPLITQLPVLNIKKALRTVGLRFIWWDAVCLPQRDFSKGFSRDKGREPPYPGPPWLSEDLQETADKELLKQKFVYEKATVGVVWLNQIHWGEDSKLRKILERTPRIITLDTVKTILYKDLDGKIRRVRNESSAVEILSNVLKGLYDPIQQPTDQNPSPNIVEHTPSLGDPVQWRSAIENFVGLLKGVRGEEGWFRSLWSFQEGRLLQAQAFVDFNGEVLPIGKPYDENGNPVSFPKTCIQVDGVQKLVNSPSIKELTAFATLLASQISLAYTAYCGHGTAAMAIPPLVTLWDPTNPASKTNDSRSCLEPIMRDLIGTGILYNSEDSPLELILAARRTRFPSLFFKDEYYAMAGVLGLVTIDKNEDYALKDGPFGYEGPKVSNERILWLRNGLPKVFFEALVKRHQWLVFLFAKRPKDSVNHWGAISMGHFETINPYCENILMQNELAVERKDWRYVLPQLAYLRETDEIRMTPAAGTVGRTLLGTGNMLKSLQALDIICHKVTTDWTSKQVLLYTLGEEAVAYEDSTFNDAGIVPEEPRKEAKPSNLVQTKSISSKELGGLGAFLLIPFDSLGFDLITVNKEPEVIRDANKLNQRCLLIRDVALSSDQRSLSAYFGGIVDVKNLVTEVLKVGEIRLGWETTLRNNITVPNTEPNRVPVVPSGPDASDSINKKETGAAPPPSSNTFPAPKPIVKMNSLPPTIGPSATIPPPVYQNGMTLNE